MASGRPGEGNRYVALLRGVNVGGANKVPMADLRALLESLGYEDVATLIQSGNAVFTAGREVSPSRIADAITDRFGLDVVVVLRSAAEMAGVEAANPFASSDTKALHVGFMAEPPDAAARARLDPAPFAPEDARLVGSEVYLYLPAGMGRAKLPAHVDRALRVPITVRNWNTVTRLAAMAAG